MEVFYELWNTVQTPRKITSFSHSSRNSIRMVNLMDMYYLNLESAINPHLWQRNWRCGNDKFCIKSSNTWSKAHFVFTRLKKKCILAHFLKSNQLNVLYSYLVDWFINKHSLKMLYFFCYGQNKINHHQTVFSKLKKILYFYSIVFHLFTLWTLTVPRYSRPETIYF